MQPLRVERPTTAFTISLVGFAIQIVAALLIVAAGMGVFEAYGRTGGMMGGMMGSYTGSGMGFMGTYSPWMMSGWGFYMWAWIPILTIALAVSAIGLLMMNRVGLDNVRTGSILVLVGAVLAFPTVWGVLAGSLLMLVGGILGLTWSPELKASR